MAYAVSSFGFMISRKRQAQVICIYGISHRKPMPRVHMHKIIMGKKLHIVYSHLFFCPFMIRKLSTRISLTDLSGKSSTR